MRIILTLTAVLLCSCQTSTKVMKSTPAVVTGGIGGVVIVIREAPETYKEEICKQNIVEASMFGLLYPAFIFPMCIHGMVIGPCNVYNDEENQLMMIIDPLNATNWQKNKRGLILKPDNDL